jgi:amino acid transporter
MIEELKEPEKLRRGFFLTNVMIATTYVLSLITFISVSRNWKYWVVGDFAIFAGYLAGNGMKYTMFAAGVLGITIAVIGSMITRTAILVNLGRKEYLNFPFLVWKHPKLGTPIFAILIVGAIQIMCLFIPFSVMVEIMNVFYCFVMIVLCASFLNLRRKGYANNLESKYKAANNNFFVVLIGISPIFVSLFMISISVLRSYVPIVSAVCCIFVLTIVFMILKHIEHKKKISVSLTLN